MTSYSNFYDAFAYFIRGNRISLVKWDYDNERWESPDEDVSSGLKVYYSKIVGFLQADGSTAWDSSKPVDESAVLNVPPQVAHALVYFVMSKLAEQEKNYKESKFYLRDFYSLIGKANTASKGTPRIAVAGKHAIR